MTTPTDKILDYFEEINTMPRCSKNEAAVGQWITAWAAKHQFSCRADTAGNLVVRIPASQGYEHSPIVVIQGHLDMVCEKTPDSGHDFTRDPIASHREGDWLTAKDTTLGADNGIAIAYALAMAEMDIGHPPMELLFTVDEETGLNGAKELTPGFIQGRILINLDSEDEGVFTIGCAGGIDTEISLGLTSVSASKLKTPYVLTVGALKGGHSGIDIHKGRGNANKILTRLLCRVSEVAPIQLVSLDGGTRKNAIPRDARAIFCADASRGEEILRAVNDLNGDIARELSSSDPDVSIALGPVDSSAPCEEGLNREDTRRVLNLLLTLPNGVYGTLPQSVGTVETSCNMATMSFAAGKLAIVSSQRSASMSRMVEITNVVHAAAALAGADTKDMDSYPPWPADMDSTLLERSIRTYRELNGVEPTLQLIHAGLECAVIGSIYDGMDMISFGPTIRDPHSPGERLHIPSIAKVWDFLVALIGEMKS